jgi:hypothetical protein
VLKQIEPVGYEPVACVEAEAFCVHNGYTRWLITITAGIALWCINNAGILVAHWRPPAGTVPTWIPIEWDVAQHITWMNAMRNMLIIPNYHLPVITQPALFCMMTFLMAQFTRLGMGAAEVYAGFQLILYMTAANCFLSCLRIFRIPRSWVLITILAAAASTPASFGYVAWTAIASNSSPNTGVIADGLFNPGPITLTFGTVSMIVALLLLTRFVLTQQRKYLYAVGVTAAFSGICHPFEVFSIVTATVLTLALTSRGIWRNAFANSLFVVVPGLCSVLPYAYFALTVPWMTEITHYNRIQVPDILHLVLQRGAPVILVFAAMLVGMRLRKTLDVILQCWFAAILFVLHVPRLPWATHATDGLGVIAALLAVRFLCELSARVSWFSAHQIVLKTISILLIAPAVTGQIEYRYLGIRDGIRLVSAYGFSAVTPDDEPDMIRWLKQNASDKDLVIAPTDEISWMLATAPVHTYASHWLFSGRYNEQADLRGDFYKGSWKPEDARDFLRTNGITLAVIPDQSPVEPVVSGYQKAAQFRRFAIYRLPNNMPQYRPGFYIQKPVI